MSLRCPYCRAVTPHAQSLAAGTPVQCPTCQQMFQAPPMPGNAPRPPAAPAYVPPPQYSQPQYSPAPAQQFPASLQYPPASQYPPAQQYPGAPLPSAPFSSSLSGAWPNPLEAAAAWPTPDLGMSGHGFGYAPAAQAPARRKTEGKMNSSIFALILLGGGTAIAIVVTIIALSFGGKSGDATSDATTIAATKAAASNGESAEKTADSSPASDKSTPTAPSTSGPTTTPGTPTSSTGTPHASIAALQPISTAPRLSYSWQPGKRYNYTFTSSKNPQSQIKGNISYVLASQSKGAATPEPTGEGQGTGFVVHPDGLLMTCAHVVEGSTKVDVILNGKTYPGEVVGLDDAHDLAMIRVSATGLPALRLADSDQVQLAEEVRAIGFPLSNYLGESIKITRGSIAGVIDQQGSKVLQVDASINPGNSGGPLVNQKGEVVGIVSSGLFGESIQEVGFTVPSNYARQLMKSKGVENSAPAGGQPLDGPELAKAVTPGVALIKVALAASLESSSQILDYQGDWRDPGTNAVIGNSRGRLSATRTGKLIREPEGDQCPLPVALGSLVLEQLPQEKKTTWEVIRVGAIPVAVQQEGFDPFAALGGRRRSSRSQGSVVLLPVVEKTEYKITSETADLLTVERNYHLVSVGRAGDHLFELTGKGTWVFDIKQGVPKSVQASVKNVSSDTPTDHTYAYELQSVVDGALPASVATTSSVPSSGQPVPPTAQPPANQPPAPVVPKENPEEKVKQVIALLKKKDYSFGKLYVPLSELSWLPPIEKYRDEVAKLIDPVLKNTNSSVRSTALNVARRWGTQANVPTLLYLLNHSSGTDRWAIMEALGGIGGNKKAAQALVKILDKDDSTHRLTASRCLREMGPVAEEPVIPLLKHSDGQVRYEVCNVLKEVGGEKGLAALRKFIAVEENGFYRAAGTIAIAAIEKRLAKK